MIDFYQGQWMYILRLQIMKENNNNLTELSCRFCSGEYLSYSLPKKIEHHLHENLTVFRFEDVNLTELNCCLCSFSLGYMCGVQCTEDQKSGLPTSRDFICFRFTFRKHLGKQHREAFCWLVLWSLMIKNRRQWLMCQAYNDQRTMQIIIIIWWVLPAVSLV